MKKLLKRIFLFEMKILDMVYRFFRQGVIKGLLFVLLGMTCLTFLLRTTSGFLMIAKLAMLFVPGTLTFKNPNGRLMDSIQIESLIYNHNSLKMEINHLSLQWQPLNLLRQRVLPIDKIQAETVTLTYGESRQRFDHLHLSGNLSLHHIQLQLSTLASSSSLGDWKINTTAEGTFPWIWTIDALLDRTNLPEIKPRGLQTAIHLSAAMTDPAHGNMMVSVQPGHYYFTDNDFLKSLPFQGGTLKAILDPTALIGKGDFGLDDNKKITVAFKLPKFRLDNPTDAEQTFSSQMHLNVATLDFLKNIHPEIKNIQGKLAVLVVAKGKLNQPKWTSQFDLQNASATLPALGLNLNPIHLVLTTQANQWVANGSIASNHQSLSLQGKGQLSPDPMGEIRVQGNQFLIANTKSYQVTISPQLMLNFTPANLNITGTLTIPTAQIQPQEFTESMTIPNDITFKTKEEKKSLPFNTTVDVNVVVHNQVTLNYQGLNTHLNGTLHLTQISPNPLSGEGSIVLTDGTYKAYGQDLTIKQGYLSFTGGALDNPSIRLRAGKYIKEAASGLTHKVRVGVQVSGQLSEPTLHLFSIPATFSQADILSLLVLGIPANQASGAGSQLLITALSSITQGTQSEDTQLLSQLKKVVGIDFDFKSKDNKLGVALSKSLTKRISIGYTIGLSQADPNVMTLKYILTKLISLQISSSDSNSGIDALYEKEIQ